MALKTATVHLTADRGQHLVPSQRSLSDIPASSRHSEEITYFCFFFVLSLKQSETTTRGVFFSFKIKKQQVTTAAPLSQTLPPSLFSLHKETIELYTGRTGPSALQSRPPTPPTTTTHLSLSLTLSISHTNMCYTQTTWRSLVKDIQEESFSTNTLFCFVVCLFCDRLKHGV